MKLRERNWNKLNAGLKKKQHSYRSDLHFFCCLDLSPAMWQYFSFYKLNYNFASWMIALDCYCLLIAY